LTDVVFITGNSHKAEYLAKLIGIPIGHHKVDLDEIQSTNLAEIIEHKVRQAYAAVQRPVVVEDVAMGFTALNGLPGPFIKFFTEQPDGLEKLCRMLDGFADRSARAECKIGFYDGKTVQIFTGQLAGTIAEHPRGSNGFGWGAIFCPEGYDGRTRAELNEQEYDEVYAVIRPFAPLRELLTSL
jgi:non-canonical purine NTP pyrophosphatase (RdgB/HAM1 family)